MRRPWELAHLQQRPAGPRVYVPFSLPDTSAAATTFAVLEFVGFSSSPSPPSSSQRPLSPSPSSPLPPPASLCHAQLHACHDSSDAPHSASHTQTSAKVHSESSASEESPTLLHYAPPASTLGADAATSSWSVVQKSASFDGRSVRVVQTHIKENVVHTTPSNFKDIVQQLTGASSVEASTGRPIAKALITAAPTVLAAAAAQPAPNKVPNAFSVKMDVRKGFKKASRKLQERRRDMCNLEKLCANKRLTVSATSTSPLLPSPVTPLAFCTSITPTTSQSSGRSSGISSPEAPMPPNSSNSPIILPYTPNIAEQCTSKGGAHACSNLHHYATLMEDHHGTPALLNLFPESSSV